MDRSTIDKETVNQFIGGSKLAFKVIYQQLTPKMLVLGKQMFSDEDAAKDFVQDVFVLAWEKREYFKRVNSFDDYLFVMARNLAIRRRQKISAEALNIRNFLLQTDSFQQPDAELKVREQELAMAISKALSSMSPQNQEIFRLSRENGLSQQEIADKVGLATQTVHNKMHNILQTIRGHIKEHLVTLALAISLALWY